MMNIKFLSLYRQILRLHQMKLTELHRSVGDKYVRTEFRSHLNVNAEQEEEFMLQWTDYAAHLATEAVSDINVFVKGRDLPEAEIDAMSDDQKVQLQKLHTSAIEVGNREKDLDKEDGSNTK